MKTVEELIKERNAIDEEIAIVETDIIKLKYNNEHSYFYYSKIGEKYSELRENESFDMNGYRYIKLLKKGDLFYIFVGTNSNFAGSHDAFLIAKKTKNITEALDIFEEYKDNIASLLYEIS